jgi:hypothetical protein
VSKPSIITRTVERLRREIQQREELIAILLAEQAEPAKAPRKVGRPRKAPAVPMAEE